jgi:prolyl oligopeptidase
MHSYPPTRRSDHTDDYHGTLVADPYRWLEDPDSAETRAWIEAQNALTFGLLERIPARQHFQQRLSELWDTPRCSAPLKRGRHYFQLRNSGLQNQDALYVTEKANPAGDTGRLLLDPNTLSPDGTVSLSEWVPSRDGRWLAYATSQSGSDWLTWRVRDVDRGEDLPDVLEWSKFSSAAWRKDGAGFYYARYNAPAQGEDFTGVNYYQKLYFHHLGRPQEKDRLIYQRTDQKEWGFDPQVSDDGHYLVINVWQGTDVRNRLFYQNLECGSPVFELIPGLEAGYKFAGNDGSLFYLHTDLDAPRGRLIAVNVDWPVKDQWRELIPQSGDTLQKVLLVHDEFVVLYLHDAHHVLRRFDLQGNLLGEIELPGLGAISETGYFLNLTGSRKDDELFYGFASFLHAPAVYRYDFHNHESQMLFAPQLDFDASSYITSQVFASGKDSVSIPIFLTHRRGLQMNGENPTLLYGYGGFGISMTPDFKADRLALLESGWVYAWAILRGGGEYGEEWHQAGMLENKPTVFDDFIACAEFLVTHQVTSPGKLAIAGGSNGGLLVGACLAQRPDLFAAALPAVGVMDMLRFHRFTIGWAWVSEYGSADDPAQFNTLYAYSPLHNLHPGTHYPATLITTADHDDRVVPAHSFKFAAALQAAQAGDAPVLIRIQTKAGHGVGKPTAVQIQEAADRWAFLEWAIGGR